MPPSRRLNELGQAGQPAPFVTAHSPLTGVGLTKDVWHGSAGEASRRCHLGTEKTENLLDSRMAVMARIGVICGTLDPVFDPCAGVGVDHEHRRDGAGQARPRYEGASSFGFSGSPSLSWRRVGETPAFSAPDDGIGLALFDNRRFRIGPVATFRAGRYSGSEAELRGLRDVPWTVEAGMFVEFWPIIDRFRTRLEVRQGFHGHHGLVADLSADWVETFGAFTLSGGPRLSLGNGSFTRKNFGITIDEAFANGRVTPFRPQGGATSAGVGAALDYRLSLAWTTTVFVRYEHFLGDAARSPIVRVLGDRNQMTFGLRAVYSFRSTDDVRDQGCMPKLIMPCPAQSAQRSR